MIKRIILIFLVLVFWISVSGQAPSKFNYQAVIRDNTDELITNQSIKLRVSIIDGSSTIYTEEHSVTTNAYGIVNIKVGEGDSPTSDFSLINWGTGTKSLKIEIDDTGGSSFSNLGSVQLLSVPYALYANSANQLGSQNIYSPDTDTLFVVKDHDGNVVFAVFPDGAAVYVNETAKGKVGGFAVSGRTPSKDIEEEYLVVTPDSTRVYVNEPTDNKSKIGGFAVSGRTPSKQTTSSLMNLTKNNYFIGHDAGVNNTTGLYNTFIGYNSGYSNTEGVRNIFLGYASGYSNQNGYNNLFIGDSTGYFNATGKNNVFLGTQVGLSNTTGYQNIAIGNWAGYNNIGGNRNIFIGTATGYYNTEGKFNVFMGNFSGYHNTIGDQNIFIGRTAGYSNTKGVDNIFMGMSAGLNNDTSSTNIFIGNYSGYWNTGGYENIFIGNESGHSNTKGIQNTMIGGVTGYHNTEGIRNTFLGIHSGNMNVTGSENVFIGAAAGHNNKEGSYNVSIGPGAGHSDTTGSYNVFLGREAGYFEMGSNKLYIENSSADSANALIYGDFGNNFLRFNADVHIAGRINLIGSDNYNMFIGDSAGVFNESGGHNTFIGVEAGNYNSSGTGNVFVGTWSGEANTIGSRNTFVGRASGAYNVEGNRNVFLGDFVGANNTHGNGNVFLGLGAGYNNVNGDSSIFIGHLAGYKETASYRLYIENSRVDSTQALIWGNFESDILGFNASVGIGTIAPIEKLEVKDGNIRVTNGSFIDDGTTLSDFVFESDYKLESIEDHSDFMWKNKHLPALTGANEIKKKGGYDISERREQMLEELEKAHIYIEQLNAKIKNQDQIIQSQNVEIEQLKQRMMEIENMIHKE